MKWRQRRVSSNVEDRRGQRLPSGRAGGILGTLAIILLAAYFGVDPRPILALLDGVAPPPTESGTELQVDPANDPLAELVAVVLADTELTWQQLFARIGRQYEEPRLILFSGATQSACGLGQAAMGPFYCPADRQVYIDLSFYRDLRERFQAPGDFAQAYVIAHEVGHHVQNLLGISGEVQRLRQQVSATEANALSVRLELQADCFAGLWAHEAERLRGVLEPGDIEEGLRAASAIGDDRLQQQSGRRVSPDSFTHGSSAQRVRWFRVGFDQGELGQCDTFAEGISL
ncbi:MAG: neutral zinc metallopeptidase [Gammaproteobacteria bacterium]|nr:neutral zinc metallopeptidase [Gammaproteobacteria bacterium]